jgi:hypothetical protein
MWLVVSHLPARDNRLLFIIGKLLIHQQSIFNLH